MFLCLNRNLILMRLLTQTQAQAHTKEQEQLHKELVSVTQTRAVPRSSANLSTRTDMY